MLLSKLGSFVLLADKATQAQTRSPFYSIGLMVVLFVIMYLIVIRPQKKKQKQVEQMRSELIPGNRVTTIGGFVGKVKKITEDEVFLVLNDDSKHFVVKKWAIQSVLDKEEAKEIDKESKKAEKIEVPEDTETVEAEVVDEIVETDAE